MTYFQVKSIVVPVFPASGANAVKRLLRIGFSLADWLGTDVHWLISDRERRHLGDWIETIGARSRKTRKVRSTLGVVSGSFKDALIEKLGEYGDSILLLSTDRRGILGLSQGISREKSEVLERSPLSVCIVPARGEADFSSINEVLVPMSGEHRASQALGLGIELGNQHGIPVDVLHVTSSEKQGHDFDRSVLGNIGDQFHHEYPRLLEELVVQGCPLSSPRDRLIIRDICHCYGEVAQEIKERIKNAAKTLLIFEWKGNLKKGRAEKVKMLLKHASGPMLLLREDGRLVSQLKIGRPFGAARSGFS